MEDMKPPMNSAQKGAQKYFTKTAQDDALSKEIRKKERSATAAKTARLRALRLNKEAADRQEADKLATEKDVTPAQRKRKPAVKSVKMVRMSY